MRAPAFLTLTRLAWLAFLVPLVATHAAYLVAAGEGRVPWCFPYLDGCTSISRAARVGWANLLFRATMLPYAALLALYWWRVQHWLAGPGGEHPRLTRATTTLGIVASAFLALYVVFLGAEGDRYQDLRRYGVTVYFAFTVLAQMLMTRLFWRQPGVPRPVRRGALAACAVLLGLGLASIPLQHFAADRDAAVNAIEWTYALLMSAFFPLTALALRPGRPV